MEDSPWTHISNKPQRDGQGRLPRFPADRGIGEQGEEVLSWDVDRVFLHEETNCPDLLQGGMGGSERQRGLYNKIMEEIKK